MIQDLTLTLSAIVNEARKMNWHSGIDKLLVIFHTFKIAAITVPLMLLDYVTDLYLIFTYASSFVWVMQVASTLLGTE